MNCENNCVNEYRLNAIEKELEELKEKNSSDNKGFYKRLENLETENALLKRDIEYIRETTDEMSENIKTMMQQPGKRYETIVVSIITSVVGLVVGFIMSGILPM